MNTLIGCILFITIGILAYYTGWLVGGLLMGC